MLAGVLLCAASASAQTATQGWYGLEHRPGTTLTDEGNKVDWYKDGLGIYVAVAGYVTEASGAKRLAVFRYDVQELGPGGELVWQQPADRAFYFPPLTVINPVGDNRATSITVDRSTNTVYVTGYTNYRVNGTLDTHLNYITLKLDSDLVGIHWQPEPGSPWVPGVRVYAAPQGLHDKAVAVALNSSTSTGDVYVTGTSQRAVADVPVQLDILTLKYDAANGSLSNTWPAVGTHPQGVRRWSRPGVNGPDIPIGLSIVSIFGNQGGETFCYVGGTSDTGTSTANNYVALGYDTDAVAGIPSGPNTFWEGHYDGGLNDVAAGIVAHPTFVHPVFMTGWSARPCAGGGGGAASMSSASPSNIDYATVRFESNVGPNPVWIQYFGNDCRACPIHSWKWMAA